MTAQLRRWPVLALLVSLAGCGSAARPGGPGPRAVRGRTLRFSPAGQGLFQDQTDTTWNIAGRAITGPLRGMQLRPLRHDEQFWFALAVPHARLLTPASGHDVRSQR